MVACLPADIQHQAVGSGNAITWSKIIKFSTALDCERKLQPIATRVVFAYLDGLGTIFIALSLRKLHDPSDKC
jgi:hypothetical protein